MEKIKDNIIASLPYSDLILKKELLSFEGNTVLSHYVDGIGNDFLFYWVDFENDINRWLVWITPRNCLFNYLRGGVSLMDLIQANNGLFYLIDKKLDLTDLQISVLLLSDLPLEYIPDKESVFEYAFPTEYKEYFGEFNYVNILRDKALNFTLKSTVSTYGDTVGVKDASLFLNNIFKSFNEYSEFDFIEKFNSVVTDVKRLSKIFKSLMHPETFRIANLSYGSFKVSLADDFILHEDGMNQQFLNWKKTTIENYRNEVIDNDFNSEVDINIIVKKFSDKVIRQKIFEPLFKIIDNPNLALSVESQDKKFTRKFKRTNPDLRKKMIPDPTLDEVVDNKFPKRKLVNMIVEIPEKESITDISKKDLSTGLLFSQDTKEFPFVITDIKYNNFNFELNQPITITVVFDGKNYNLYYEELGLKVVSETKEDLKNNFEKAFYELYINSTKLKEIIVFQTAQKLLIKNLKKLNP